MLSKRFLPESCREQRYYGGSPVEDVTSRVEPWSGAQPHYLALYTRGRTAFNATPTTPYPGTWFAKANTWDTEARTANQRAINTMEADVSLIRSHATRVLAGEYLRPEDNPFLEGAVDSALEQLRRKFSDEIYPTILDVAIRSGAYSGTGHEVITAKALEDLDFQGAKIAESIYYENYTRERQLQENAPQLMVVAETIQQKIAQLNQINADQYRGLIQLNLDEAVKDFEEQLIARWRGLAEFSAVLTGGGFHTQTTHDPSKQENKFANLFQGTLGGAVTGYSVGGPVGGAIGGLIGGIGGLFM